MRPLKMVLALTVVVAAAGWVIRGPQACAPATDGSAPQRAADPPNVLFILWDTARADRMSVYGHDRPTTPWLERFAEEAVVYERAISPSMWTVPAHASLFTGLPATTHGADTRWIWLDDRFETLAERLGAAGYATFAFSSNPYLSPATNLLKGFQTVELAWEGRYAEATAAHTASKLLPQDRSVEISPGWDPEGHGPGWPEHLTVHKDGAPVIGEALLEWVDSRPEGQPWMAFLNLLEAHHPRIPSLEARRAVGSEAEVEAGLSTDACLFHIMAAMEGKHAFEPEAIEAMRTVYDATLRDLDAATEQLVEGLRARGLLDETVVVILSDHGEHLGEHGMFDHRWSVWQELLHVPLIIRYPDAFPPQRVDAPVNTSDLFATTLDLVGLAVPPEMADRSLRTPPDGRAYAELLQPTPRLPQIRAAFPDLDARRWRARYHVLVQGSEKLIRRVDGRLGLYDLQDDPMEQRDLAVAEPARALGLQATLRAWWEAQTPYDPAERAPTDRPRPALEQPRGVRDQLKMLGYMDE